jgi:hypothetical protein
MSLGGINTHITLNQLLQFNHTMLRIKDPNVSIPFYTDVSFSSISRLPCIIFIITSPATRSSEWISSKASKSYLALYTRLT